MPDLSRDGIVPVVNITNIEPSIFRVLEITKTAHSQLLDHAIILVDLGSQAGQRYVQNLDLNALTITTPEGPIDLRGAICSIIAEVDGQTRTLHWGKTTVSEVRIPDSITLVSRLEEHHFGKPLGYQKVYDPISHVVTRSDHAVVFNPEIKGKIFGNKRTGNVTISDDPIFIQFGSVQTVAAQNFQGVLTIDIFGDLATAEAASENWSLVDAADYLFKDCNSAQQYVLNPTLAELQQVLPDSQLILKNHELRAGIYLPAALEQLLEPYGFYAYIEYESPTVRRIKIMRHGLGRERTVKLQAVGQKLDPELSGLVKAQLQYDSSMAVNQVLATGGFTEMEATFELKPAWDAELDSTPIGDLYKSKPFWVQDPKYARVWRDWVLNEARDYPRPSSNGNVDLTTMFRLTYGQSHPEVAPVRRKFLPCLTRGIDGEPIGKEGHCVVEWYNPLKPGGAGWQALDVYEYWSCKLLEHECGISFTGETPPVDLFFLGNNAKVRITATIRSDTRISYLAARLSSSVNVDVKQATLDVGRSFHARALHPLSKFFPALFSGTVKADIVDGRTALQTFALDLRDTWDQAACSGTLQLEGLDVDIKIGDVITGITGRTVSFNTTMAAGGEGRYPQVVGITLDVQEQRTIVTINEFRETNAFVASFIRKTRRLK